MKCKAVKRWLHLTVKDIMPGCDLLCIFVNADFGVDRSRDLIAPLFHLPDASRIQQDRAGSEGKR